MEEFLAQLRAAVRRGSTVADGGDPVIETSEFTVDLRAKKVTRAGTDVHLTPTEWGILELLARHQGNLVSQSDILTHVWGPSYRTQTNYLRVSGRPASQARSRSHPPAAPAHRSGNGIPSGPLRRRAQHPGHPSRSDPMRPEDRWNPALPGYIRSSVGCGGLKMATRSS